MQFWLLLFKCQNWSHKTLLRQTGINANCLLTGVCQQRSVQPASKFKSSHNQVEVTDVPSSTKRALTTAIFIVTKYSTLAGQGQIASSTGCCHSRHRSNEQRCREWNFIARLICGMTETYHLGQAISECLQVCCQMIQCRKGRSIKELSTLDALNEPNTGFMPLLSSQE